MAFDIKGDSAAEREDVPTVVLLNDEFGKPDFYTENGEEKQSFIEVCGSYSNTYRKAEREIQRRPIKPKKLTGEKFYDDNLEKIVACTKRWGGFVVNGMPVELNRHNAAAVYEKYPHVLEQVAEAMNEHERWFQGDAGAAA